MSAQVVVSQPSELITQNELVHYSNTVRQLKLYEKNKTEGRATLLDKVQRNIPVEPGPLTLNVQKKDDKKSISYKAAVEVLKATHPELVAEIDKAVADATTHTPVHYLQVVPAVQNVADVLSDEVHV